MPQQWKKADYGASAKSRVETPREDWYRVAEGFTHGNRVCYDGEIFHISELDMQGPNGENVESFRPLKLEEQIRRFGRVMYMPYKPTDEELEALGWEREDVRADPAESQAQMDQQLQDSNQGGASSDVSSDEFASMSKDEMREYSREKYQMELPEQMPENRMRAALRKTKKEQEAQGGK